MPARIADIHWRHPTGC